MRILYVTSGASEDYQRDVLFHGLRELLGSNAVDVNRIASLYHQDDASKSRMYGRGYTVYGNLPNIPVDRDNIQTRIRAKEFDLVFYGSIHRCADYLREVRDVYPPSRIVYVDGEDETRLKWSLLGTGIYFKRELRQAMPPYLRPIYFAVPKEKFVSQQEFEAVLCAKIRPVAQCDPRDRSTYVFSTETAYYQQYRESFFGVTMRKAGWDCMRHHEIVSQGSAPLFLDLESCPAWTLHRLPREELLELRGLYERDPQIESIQVRARYRQLLRQVFAHYTRTFTTAALAEYVLASVAASTRLDTGPRAEAVQARWWCARVWDSSRRRLRAVWRATPRGLCGRSSL